MIAAPVIIRAGILMPIKVIEPVKVFTLADYQRLIETTMNNRIKEFQDKIANQILYGTNNVHYLGGLASYVKERNVRVLTNVEYTKK